MKILCPLCKAGDVECERFTGKPVLCPHCFEWLDTEHECHHTNGDSWCEDWLAPTSLTFVSAAMREEAQKKRIEG